MEYVGTVCAVAAWLGLSYALAFRAAPWAFARVMRAIGRPLRFSPVLRRRAARFRQIRRGYWSYIVITTLFTASLFLELTVSEKALYVRCGDRWAMPAVMHWLDTTVPFVQFRYFQRASDFGLASDSQLDYRAFARLCDDPGSIAADLAARRGRLAREVAALGAPPPAPRAPVAPVEPAPGASAAEVSRYKDALFEFEMNLEDYERARPQIEAKHASALELYTLKGRALDTQRDDIARIEASYERFTSGAASIVMPLYPYGPDERLLSEFPDERPPIPPRLAHPLGLTDNAADVLCQVLYGFRIAMVFALIVAGLGFAIGILVGGAMGYYGGWVDILVQRFIEIWGSIPFLFTMMILASIIKPGLLVLAFMMLILRSWMGITYLIRGEFYREKARDYVQAAKSIGVSDWTIITKHILPNSLVPVVTSAPFAIVAYIGSLVSLDFLGFGLKPGTPSWGYLLQQGKTHVGHMPNFFLIVVPSAVFAGTLFLVVMIGEAVREGFDPKVFSRLR